MSQSLNDLINKVNTDNTRLLYTNPPVDAKLRWKAEEKYGLNSLRVFPLRCISLLQRLKFEKKQCFDKPQMIPIKYISLL